jgi:DNA modification methylase
MFQTFPIHDSFDPTHRAVIYSGDCVDLLSSISDDSIQLIVTSPPYNIGKEYEKKLRLKTYLEQQAKVIKECAHVLSTRGSVCWQVGDNADKSHINSLDTDLSSLFSAIHFVNIEGCC